MLKKLEEGMSLTDFARASGRSKSQAGRIVMKLADLDVVRVTGGKPRRIEFTSPAVKEFFMKNDDSVLDLLFLKKGILFAKKIRNKPFKFALRTSGMSYEGFMKKLRKFRELGLARINTRIIVNPEIEKLIEEMTRKEILEGPDAHSIIDEDVKDPERIIVRSLKRMKDRRDGLFIQLFYLKFRNRINLGKLFDFAYQCGVEKALEDLISSINLKRTKRFAGFTDLVEKAEIYGIKIKASPKQQILELLSLIEGVKLILIGGTFMVFQNLKSATKDIDIAVWDEESAKKVTEQLSSRGILFERTKIAYFTKEPVRIDIFPGTIFGFPASNLRIESEKEAGKTTVLLPDLSSIFLLKIRTGREVDLDDCLTLVRSGEIDYRWVLDNLSDTEIFFLKDFIEYYGIEVPRRIKRDVEKRTIKVLSREMKKKGKSMAQIAKELGVSYSRVRSVLNEH